MTCTCKRTNDYCWDCGHDRKDCSEPCQRGMHARCRKPTATQVALEEESRRNMRLAREALANPLGGWDEYREKLAYENGVRVGLTLAAEKEDAGLRAGAAGEDFWLMSSDGKVHGVRHGVRQGGSGFEYACGSGCRKDARWIKIPGPPEDDCT